MKTLRDIAEEMHEYRRSINFSPRTEESVRFMLKLFFEFIEHNFSVETVSDLRPSHLEAYQEHLPKVKTKLGMPIKAGSMNNRIGAVKALCEFMHRRGYTVGNIGNHISNVKEPQLLATSVLTHKQIKHLMRQIDTREPLGYRDRTMLELLYSTGVRNSELTGLLMGNVNLDEATMKVVGKGNKERIVPIGRTALQWLTSYIRGIRPFVQKSETRKEVFLTHNGNPLKSYTLRHVAHKHAKKVELETVVTPHTFRRSCATELIRGDANLYHVKELLGHASLNTLKHYTKLTINDLRRTHAKCHPRERDS